MSETLREKVIRCGCGEGGTFLTIAAHVDAVAARVDALTDRIAALARAQEEKDYRCAGRLGNRIRRIEDDLWPDDPPESEPELSRIDALESRISRLEAVFPAVQAANMPDPATNAVGESTKETGPPADPIPEIVAKWTQQIHGRTNDEAGDYIDVHFRIESACREAVKAVAPERAQQRIVELSNALERTILERESCKADRAKAEKERDRLNAELGSAQARMHAALSERDHLKSKLASAHEIAEHYHQLLTKANEQTDALAAELLSAREVAREVVEHGTWDDVGQLHTRMHGEVVDRLRALAGKEGE